MTTSNNGNSTGVDQPGDPLILSLTMDGALFEKLDSLRREHFPVERNFLSAHLTLFHHLPAEELPAITQHLNGVCEETHRFDLQVPKLRFLGKGVAAVVVAPQLLALHAGLARQWLQYLSAQDRQRLSPHVTLQNKVDPAVARGLFEKLSPRWMGLNGQAIGLSLWWYRGGPWELAAGFAFQE